VHVKERVRDAATDLLERRFCVFLPFFVKRDIENIDDTRPSVREGARVVCFRKERRAHDAGRDRGRDAHAKAAREAAETKYLALRAKRLRMARKRPGTSIACFSPNLCNLRDRLDRDGRAGPSSTSSTSSAARTVFFSPAASNTWDCQRSRRLIIR
jgi:hypothetical protein